MEHRVPVGPLLGGVGALIVAVSLFFDWWDGVTAFDAYEVLDLVLLGLAAVIIVQLAGGLGLVRPAARPTTSLLVAVLTVVIVISQLIDDPPAVAGRPGGHALGIWLALLGGGLMTIGALLAYGHISLALHVRPHAAGTPPDAEGSAERRPGAPADGDDHAATVRMPGTPAGAAADSPPAVESERA
jgi:hypothetical protein